MKLVIDIEADGLRNPTRIWCIVCKDIETGEHHVFGDVSRDDAERSRFIRLADDADALVGHNWCGYDLDVLNRLVPGIDGVRLTSWLLKSIDTLVISKLANYTRKKHSIKDYGLEFGLEKLPWTDFSKFDPAMVEYCKKDTDICALVYTKYLKYISNSCNSVAINLENNFVYYVVNSLSKNGFSFNLVKAKSLLKIVEDELSILNKDISQAYPKRLSCIREVIPKGTKHGTISLSSIPKLLRPDIHEYSIGSAFCYCSWTDFNPSSHKQVVDILTKAGWRPESKTDTHLDTERSIAHLDYQRNKTPEDIQRLSDLKDKLDHLKIYGWKINEENLATLPPKAPKAASLLAKRILLESRRRTLVEWINLCTPEERIHGDFYGIGAWTHRMAHQKPNTANIPNEYDEQKRKKLLGKEMRQLWRAPKGRLLVGVDAEGIQLRIFAHLINDPEFTFALENGKKEDKSDPHSLNHRILGDVCRSRLAAKRFIFALLLGGGMGKLASILDCDKVQAEEALDRVLDRYQGFAYLKAEVIPKDARRGWFTGLDGRCVPIPGDTVGARRHLAMSGYLQNGEKVVMAKASLKFINQLAAYDALLVDLVHDEWQVECPNDVKKAIELGEIMASSLVEVGKELKLNCQLAGSLYNDDIKDYTIGTNWYQTH